MLSLVKIHSNRCTRTKLPSGESRNPESLLADPRHW